jgi:hypothetical protein
MPKASPPGDDVNYTMWILVCAMIGIGLWYLITLFPPQWG